jgi:hypothetical protein
MIGARCVYNNTMIPTTHTPANLPDTRQSPLLATVFFIFFTIMTAMVIMSLFIGVITMEMFAAVQVRWGVTLESYVVKLLVTCLNQVETILTSYSSTHSLPHSYRTTSYHTTP